eukprot:2517122-Pleurochrysis_carterae.AAC.1
MIHAAESVEFQDVTLVACGQDDICMAVLARATKSAYLQSANVHETVAESDSLPARMLAAAISRVSSSIT